MTTLTRIVLGVLAGISVGLASGFSLGMPIGAMLIAWDASWFDQTEIFLLGGVIGGVAGAVGGIVIGPFVGAAAGFASNALGNRAGKWHLPISLTVRSGTLVSAAIGSVLLGLPGALVGLILSMWGPSIARWLSLRSKIEMPTEVVGEAIAGVGIGAFAAIALGQSFIGGAIAGLLLGAVASPIRKNASHILLDWAIDLSAKTVVGMAAGGTIGVFAGYFAEEIFFLFAGVDRDTLMFSNKDSRAYIELIDLHFPSYSNPGAIIQHAIQPGGGAIIGIVTGGLIGQVSWKPTGRIVGALMGSVVGFVLGMQEPFGLLFWLPLCTLVFMVSGIAFDAVLKRMRDTPSMSPSVDLQNPAQTATATPSERPEELRSATPVPLKEKSVAVSVVLTILFGPLGLLYTTIRGGIGMSIVSFILGTVSLGTAMVVIYPVCIAWGVIAARRTRRPEPQQV